MLASNSGARREVTRISMQLPSKPFANFSYEEGRGHRYATVLAGATF